MKKRTWLARAAFFFGTVILSARVHAYPEFIGYGYQTCLTCHYSGTGGDGLTDYGRALWAAEIARHPFWNPNADDEKLGDESGFLGKVKTPYWLKPGLKYRRLYMISNPGSSEKSTHDYIMQTDLNLASFTSEDEKLGAVATVSYLYDDPLMAAPNRRIGQSEFFMREYYVRWRQNNDLIWYFGFFDKAYGIKQVDHTAFSRTPLKVGENDQVHGVMAQWQHGNHEVFIQPFMGNLNLPVDQQSRGLTTKYEYSLDEKRAVGVSAKYEASKAEKIGTLGGDARIGLGTGNALLFELGLRQDQLTGAQQTLGYYQYLEFNYCVSRGINVQSVLQSEKTDFSRGIPIETRWGFGLVYFPMQRMEWRFQLLQYRDQSDQQVEDDQWYAQAQLHLSL